MAGGPSDGVTLSPNGAAVDNGVLRDLGTGDGLLADPKKAYKAKSVREAVDKILMGLKAGQCIKSLTFVGHGNSGHISVGAGLLPDSLVEGEEIDGRSKVWEKQLKKLCNRICKDTPEIEIILLGCNTGVCQEGARKLWQLANFFRDCTKPHGNTNRFCAYGSKRLLYEKDVKDVVVGGKRDVFVRVCSGLADDPKSVPDCLAEMTKDGLKPSPKPRPRGRGKQEDVRLPRLTARDYVGLAFRRPERVARPYLDTAMLVPQPIEVAEFLSLFDWSQSYDYRGLSAHTNGEAVFVRRDLTTERLPITASCTGIVLNANEVRHLFVLRDLADADVVANLIATDPPLDGDAVALPTEP